MRDHVAPTILVLFAAACGPGDATPDGAVDAGIPSSVRIRASEGGSVHSPDGVFMLIVPPGAIAEDTDVSISIVPRDEWPADLTPIGELYDVQPDGLVFLTPAYGLHVLPASTPELRTPEGDYRFAAHFMRSADGTIEAARTTTYATTSATAVVAEIAHLSAHWIEDGDVSMRVRGEAGAHDVGESWTIDELTLHYGPSYEAPPAVDLRSWVLTDADFYVVPTDHEGWQPFDGIFVPPEVSRSDHGVILLTDYPEFRSSSSSRETITSPWAAPAPLPGWSCVSERDPGTAVVVAGATLEGLRRVGRYGGRSYLELSVEIGSPSCLAAPPAAQPVADHVLVAETCRLEPTPSGLACDGATSGSTVLIQQLSEAERAGCTALGPSTLRCSAPSGESERGADPIEIETPSASCTATYDDGTRRYVCDIAPDQSVFGAGSGETLTIRGTPPGESTPTTITVPATDAIAPPESVLGPLAGLDTSIQVADGTFDAVFIRAQVPSASGPPDVVYDVVPASSMTLSGGVRSTPVLTPQLRAGGITELIGDILIGVAHTAEDTTLFQTPGAPPTARGHPHRRRPLHRGGRRRPRAAAGARRRRDAELRVAPVLLHAGHRQELRERARLPLRRRPVHGHQRPA
ncbi:MAG: hypothetical protein M5U28_42030 [Sandaracinaceae bacterium]|nr:hypothetical protein [Sandaracinaceae bacterium]